MHGSLEVRVGLFVCFTLLIFLGFLFFLGDFRLGGGLEVYADFHFTGALRNGSSVRVSGIRIGKISSLQYVANRDVDPPLYKSSPDLPIQVRATIKIDKDYVDIINDKSSFIISQSGMFGEPYLELIRDISGRPVSSGYLFRGRDAARMDLLFSSISSVLDGLNLEKLDLDAITTLMKDGSALASVLQRIMNASETKIPELLDNANKTVGSFKTLADKGTNLLAETGDLSKTLRNAKNLTGKLSSQSESLLDEAHGALNTVKKAEKIINAIDEEKISNILTSADATMANLQNTTKNLDYMSGKVKSGQGSIGALLMTSEIYDDLKQLVEDLKQHPWKVLWRK